MSIATKADLKTKAASWLRRSGNAAYVAEVDDFISLAEAKLNRELGPVETDAALVAVPASNAVSISALSVVEPLALFLTQPGGSAETPLQMQAPASIAVSDATGQPSVWAMNGTASLIFDCPCDIAYGLRFHYRERFALAADGDINWLLTNHPDIYLAATLMWGAGYLESWENGAVWKGLLGEGLAEVKRELGARKRGSLRADDGMIVMGGGR